MDNEEISLQAACDWLEYKTDRRLSTPGLKKHIDKIPPNLKQDLSQNILNFNRRKENEKERHHTLS